MVNCEFGIAKLRMVNFGRKFGGSERVGGENKAVWLEDHQAGSCLAKEQSWECNWISDMKDREVNRKELSGAR